MVWGIVAIFFHKKNRSSSYIQYYSWIKNALPSGDKIFLFRLAVICWAICIVFKASVRRRLGAKAQLEVKASRRIEIRRKATVAAEKNLKRGAAAAGRRKSGDGGSESGFGDLRFGPESPSSPLIRGGGSSSSRSGDDGWDRRRGGGGSRGRGGGGGSRGGW
jgi:hypothetical protein